MPGEEPVRTRPEKERETRIEPTEVELIRFRDSHTPLEFRVVTGELLEGVIRYYDSRAIRIIAADRTEITIFFSALVYFKTRS